MNFYPHHIGDYRADTVHLSNEEDLAYRRLLEMYYDTEKPIPLETQWVSRRLRVDTQAIEVVLNDFFFESNDGWHNSRCDREIAIYQRLQEKNRQNGKKGGRPKSLKTNINNPVGLQSVNSGLPVETNSEGNQEPLTINQEPINKYSGCPADAEPTAKTVTLKKMVEEGVDRQTASDWLTLRKAKRLPLTQTAWDSTKSEGTKVGMTAQETVAYAVKNNWAGFKASWCVKESSASAPSITVPPRQGIDPTLAGLIKESLSGAVKPPNDEIRRRMRELSGERA